MSYILGYIAADGCITVSKDRKTHPFSLNITSAGKKHLYKIRKALESEHKISRKFGGKIKNIAYQLQIRNPVIVKDLMNLGILPKKTHNLNPIKVPEKYFPDFVRGFFDGDGTVYIYKVNNVWQIKSGFVCVRLPFIDDFNKKLCLSLNIPLKSIHKSSTLRKITIHEIAFYINDSEKLADFMYKNADLYLERKKRIFDEWKLKKRRHYIKENYPSKIGWHLNEKVYNT